MKELLVLRFEINGIILVSVLIGCTEGRAVVSVG